MMLLLFFLYMWLDPISAPKVISRSRHSYYLRLCSCRSSEGKKNRNQYTPNICILQLHTVNISTDLSKKKFTIPNRVVYLGLNGISSSIFQLKSLQFLLRGCWYSKRIICISYIQCHVKIQCKRWLKRCLNYYVAIFTCSLYPNFNSNPEGSCYVITDR